MLLELGGSKFLRDAAHKNVVVDDLLRVGAEKVIVEWKRTRRLAGCELEVAHLLASELEFVLFRDLHDGRVEGTVQITADLRDTGQYDAGLVLEDRGEPCAGGFTLGQVVEVEVVLGTLSVVHNHFVDVFFVLFVDLVSFVCVFVY